MNILYGFLVSRLQKHQLHHISKYTGSSLINETGRYVLVDQITNLMHTERGQQVWMTAKVVQIWSVLTESNHIIVLHTDCNESDISYFISNIFCISISTISEKILKQPYQNTTVTVVPNRIYIQNEPTKMVIGNVALHWHNTF